MVSTQVTLVFYTMQPSKENREDVFSELEWLFWTFSGIIELKTVWKKIHFLLLDLSSICRVLA